MATKPILFNTEMVRALLDGRKSCTRRLVKPQPQGYFEVSEEPLYIYDTDGKQGKITPPYQPGDILYVRETFIQAAAHIFWYKADDKPWMSKDLLWKPSIHMPKEAARIWLKVKNVRVERLQEMKPVDVIKEGAYPDCWDCLNTYEESGSQCCYGTEEQCSQCDGVMMEWEKLWNSTIKQSDLDRYGWAANPWVWVIEFERCKKPKGEN